MRWRRDSEREARRERDERQSKHREGLREGWCQCVPQPLGIRMCWMTVGLIPDQMLCCQPNPLKILLWQDWERERAMWLKISIEAIMQKARSETWDYKSWFWKTWSLSNIGYFYDFIFVLDSFTLRSCRMKKNSVNILQNISVWRWRWINDHWIWIFLSELYPKKHLQGVSYNTGFHSKQWFSTTNQVCTNN